MDRIRLYITIEIKRNKTLKSESRVKTFPTYYFGVQFLRNIKRMIAFFVIALYTLKLLGEGVPPFIVIMSLLFERFCAIQKGCDGQYVSTF